jgi:hypothetical protein
MPPAGRSPSRFTGSDQGKTGLYTLLRNVLNPPPGTIAIAQGWRGDLPRPDYSQKLFPPKNRQSGNQMLRRRMMQVQDQVKKAASETGHPLQFPLQLG